MNVLELDAGLNSGDESGWTLYLEHSSSASYHCKEEKFVGSKRDGLFKGTNRTVDGSEEEEEEEDLSMVSDASSGPPHFNEENDECDYSNYFCKRQRRIKRMEKHSDEVFLLDDTASSPLFTLKSNGLSKGNQASMESSIEYSQSQGFSATHFQGRSAFQESYGFGHSPLSRTQMQTNQW